MARRRRGTSRPPTGAQRQLREGHHGQPAIPRWWRALAVLVVSLAGAALLVARQESVRGQPGPDQPAATRISVSFGPEQIWQPSRSAIEGLHACAGQTSSSLGAVFTFTCVQQVMQQDGATPDAIAFFRLTGWFLSGLQDTGVVQLGRIFTPWRANENDQWALLGGIPAVIYPDREAAPLRLENNPDYAAATADHPNAFFWPSSPQFEGVDTSPQDGPRFIFRYRVLDGCRACAILAYARSAFDFAPDGTYEGFRLLNVVPQPAP